MHEISLSFGGTYDELSHLQDEPVIREVGLGIKITRLPGPFHAWKELICTEEGDGGEMSFSFYATLRSRLGDDVNFVGVPVYSYRIFPQNKIVVNENSGIASPSDLAGKTVALSDYCISMAVWLRGLLMHEYGVHPNSIAWKVSRDPADLDADLACYPDDVDITRGVGVSDLLDKVASGEFDAYVGQLPSPLPPGVRPLFPDREASQAYYRELQIFPIMHVTLLRRSSYEQDPAIANKLFQACVRSQAMAHPTGDQNERLDLAGKWWPFGIAANREILKTFVTYMDEQGLLWRSLDPEDLFLPMEPAS